MLCIDKPIKILVLGLRGFPQVQGGIEAHAEHLYPLLANLGVHIKAIVRSPYMSKERCEGWMGIEYARLWSPRIKGIEAIIHTLIGVLYAAVSRPDLLHIHGIGPALFTPLARLLGLRVVVTHHGQDYFREKWGPTGRFVLRLGERLGMRFANQRIVITKALREHVKAEFGVDSILIPNGVIIRDFSEGASTLETFGLEPFRYVLLVSRLVPEKRHLDLIEAFEMADLPGWKLVLVGDADNPGSYQNQLKRRVESTTNVVMTGFQTGKSLHELYANAGLFVLPSSHEGLPISLLEALSYGLPVLASDIVGNLEVGLETECYFPLGNVLALSQLMRYRTARQLDASYRQEIKEFLRARYDWFNIAERTLEVYQSIVRPGSDLDLGTPRDAPQP